MRSILSEDNRTFIAVPNDPVALSQMIEDLAADQDLRQQIGAANKAKAVEEFDQSAMIERYRALYSDVTGRQF